MRPGEKTRVPLRTAEPDSEGATRSLKMTVVFHPVQARIGTSMILGGCKASGEFWLDTAVIGRTEPCLDDGKGLDEAHISRRALVLRRHARGIELSNVSETSYILLGADKASSISLSENDLHQGVAIRFGHAVVCWLRLVQDAIEPATQTTDFPGVSPEATKVSRLVRIAASSDLPVLLRGESGTGKEVVATAIHAASSRSQVPLVVINMAALPETLAEAALFGSAKGAFTGAEQRSGYFTQADSGTLFLDEIGDVPVSVQPKLLRALQTGEIQVVGGRHRSVDVRIIAASDANLNDRSHFKNALLQRLSGITIDLPPLTARREDMGILLTASDQTRSLIDRLESSRDVAAWASFIFDALHRDWPGNVRAFLFAAQEFALSLKHDSERVTAAPFTRADREAAYSPSAPALTDEDIESAYEQSDFEIAETARRLGLSRGTLYRRVEDIPSIRLSAEYPDAEIRHAIDKVGRDLPRLSRALRLSKASIASRLRMMEAQL